jgi:tetratricopeptide (TPR) repeat protein
MRLFCIIILLLCLPACAPTTAQKDVDPAQQRQLAQELLSKRDMKGATEAMRLVLDSNPNIADALLYADLAESLGDYKSARRAYQRASDYAADEAQKQTLSYRLALLEAADFNNLKAATRLAGQLPADDSRYLDLQSALLYKQGLFDQALDESKRALLKAKTKEEKGWAYFHMSLIYYELRVERDTFRALFEATNNGRGHSLVSRITEFWESKRHEPFPKD